MSRTSQSFCFCTLALGAKYRNLTKQLASDLEIYAPGTQLVVGTDKPEDFKTTANVLAFEQHWQGILFCFHDRRFVIEKALTEFQTAIHIDADTRIKTSIPAQLEFLPGIIGRTESLLEHNQKFAPERLPFLNNLASKLELDLSQTIYVGESLYAVTRDEGREKEFVRQWDRIGRYLELHKIHAGDGNAIGLAAAKAGLNITTTEAWSQLNAVTIHLDASDDPSPKTSTWSKFQKKLAYYYRLSKNHWIALQEFKFYYP